MTLEEATPSPRLPALLRKSAELAGGSVAYCETGEGEAILLLHGIGSSSRSWRRAFERWRGRARLIAWDAPGYGGSTPLARTSPSAVDYANALDEFIQQMGLKRLRIVGHSLGAIIAASYAAANPQKILGLMLLNPARGYGSESRECREEKLASRLSALDELGPKGLAETRAARLLSDRASPEALETVKSGMAQITAAGYAQAARLLAHADILEDARKVVAPVLVVCGSEDAVTPPELAKTIAKAIPSAVYREISHAGHASYVECPDAFCELLNEWIGR